MRGFLSLASVFLVALAGCVQPGGGGGQQVPTDDLSAPDAEFDERTGAIRGTVLGSDFLPIAGAQAGLQGRDGSRTTAADGTFTFSRLEPGEYVVLVSKLQYQAASLAATVRAGEATQVDVTLEPVPIVEPFFEVSQFTGFITCSVGYALVLSEECGAGAGTPAGRFGTDPNNKIDWAFNVENTAEFPQLQTMYLELSWRPASAAASQLGFHVAHGFVCEPSCEETTNFCDVFENYGPPVQTCTVNVDQLGITDPASQLPYDITARAWAAPSGETESPNIVFQQPFTMYRTDFYGQGVPEGYSAVPAE